MNCSIFCAQIFRPIIDLKRSFAAILFISVFTLTFTFSADSQTTSPAEDVPKLIKKAGKLIRAESLVEAEALLRRAVELAPEKSAAKIELAFVLAKQRRLLDAYNLVLPVAEADRRHDRRS